MQEPVLSRKEAASHLIARGLRISVNRLAQLASRKGGRSGPPYKLWRGHRAVYERTKLDAWADAQLTEPKGRAA